MIQDLISLAAIFAAVGFMLRSLYLKSKVMRRDIIIRRQLSSIEYMKKALLDRSRKETEWPEVIDL